MDSQTEHDELKRVLVRMTEENIIEESHREEMVSTMSLNEIKLALFALLKAGDWEKSVRILQLVKCIDAKQSSKWKKVSNPMQIEHIVERVAHYLPFQELKECTLVCKAWSDIADPILKSKSTARIPNMRRDEIIRIPDYLATFANAKCQVTSFKLDSSYFELRCTDYAELTTFFELHGKTMTELNLLNLMVGIEGEQLDHYDMTSLFADSPITKLTISTNEYFTQLIIPLDVFPHIRDLELENCFIKTGNGIKISPHKISLTDIEVIDWNASVGNFSLNTVLDFSKVKRVDIKCSDFVFVLDVSIPSEPDVVVVDELSLINVIVEKWTESHWTVKDVYLDDVGLDERTTMQIQNLNFFGVDIVDLSALPLTIEKLSLTDSRTNVICTQHQHVHLPLLKTLTLYGNFEMISRFVDCINLTELDIDGSGVEDVTINTENLPRSLKVIKMENIELEGDEDQLFQLEKLILTKYTFSDALYYAQRLLKPDVLVLDWKPGDTFEIDDAVEQFALRVRLKWLVVGELNLRLPNFRYCKLPEGVQCRGHDHFIFSENHDAKIVHRDDFRQFMELSNVNVYKKYIPYYNDLEE